MIKYKIDKSQEIIFANILESISLEEIMIHISNINKDQDFSNGYHSVITVDDNLTVPHIKPEKIQLIQDVINGYAKMRPGTKWAVVISSGVTRSIAKTALDLIAPISANICLFHNTNDAIAWINK